MGILSLENRLPPQADKIVSGYPLIPNGTVFGGHIKHLCYMFDILDGGVCSDVKPDSGELVKAYPIGDGDRGGKGGMSFTKREKISVISPGRYAK